ncbi:Palmitoyltransferase [Pyrenophora tritici-repentis]|nr:Palmitoyltransferase [Pyrenophora tritici-repentis]
MASPLALFGYHIYLIWAGMTTNESGKWSDWSDDMVEGVVFLGQRREDTMHGHSSSSSFQSEEDHRQPGPGKQTHTHPHANWSAPQIPAQSHQIRRSGR